MGPSHRGLLNIPSQIAPGKLKAYKEPLSITLLRMFFVSSILFLLFEMVPFREAPFPYCSVKRDWLRAPLFFLSFFSLFKCVLASL